MDKLPLQPVIDALPQGVILIDLEMRIVAVNGRAEHLASARANEIVGRTMTNAFPVLEDDATRVATLYASPGEEAAGVVELRPGLEVRIRTRPFKVDGVGFALVLMETAGTEAPSDAEAELERLRCLLDGAMCDLNNALCVAQGSFEMLRIHPEDARLATKLETSLSRLRDMLIHFLRVVHRTEPSSGAEA